MKLCECFGKMFACDDLGEMLGRMNNTWDVAMNLFFKIALWAMLLKYHAGYLLEKLGWKLGKISAITTFDGVGCAKMITREQQW